MEWNIHARKSMSGEIMQKSGERAVEAIELIEKLCRINFQSASLGQITGGGETFFSEFPWHKRRVLSLFTQGMSLSALRQTFCHHFFVGVNNNVCLSSTTTAPNVRQKPRVTYNLSPGPFHIRDTNQPLLHKWTSELKLLRLSLKGGCLPVLLHIQLFTRNFSIVESFH